MSISKNVMKVIRRKYYNTFLDEFNDDELELLTRIAKYVIDDKGYAEGSDIFICY